MYTNAYIILVPVSVLWVSMSVLYVPMSLLWVSTVPLVRINPGAHGAHGAHGAYECPWESYGVQGGCPWCPWFPWCPWCSNVVKLPGKKLCTRLNTGPLPCWSKTLSLDNPLDTWELSLLWGTYTVAFSYIVSTQYYHAAPFPLPFITYSVHEVSSCGKYIWLQTS